MQSIGDGKDPSEDGPIISGERYCMSKEAHTHTVNPRDQ